MLIWFTASVIRKLLSVYVLSYFPFGFEGRMWDLIVSVLDHCLSFLLLELINGSSRETNKFRDKYYDEIKMKTRQKRVATDTWRSLTCRTTPLEHWSKIKPTVEPRWAKQ